MPSVPLSFERVHQIGERRRQGPVEFGIGLYVLPGQLEVPDRCGPDRAAAREREFGLVVAGGDVAKDDALRRDLHRAADLVQAIRNGPQGRGEGARPQCGAEARRQAAVGDCRWRGRCGDDDRRGGQVDSNSRPGAGHGLNGRVGHFGVERAFRLQFIPCVARRRR